LVPNATGDAVLADEVKRGVAREEPFLAEQQYTVKMAKQQP
jgi:hypothetical protein